MTKNSNHFALVNENFNGIRRNMTSIYFFNIWRNIEELCPLAVAYSLIYHAKLEYIEIKSRGPFDVGITRL